MHAQHARAGLTQSSLHPNLTIKPPCHASRRQLVLCAAVSKAAVGIDLGTTNSVVAVLREDEAHPTVIHDSSSGSFTVPSVVSYNGPSAQPLVGRAAKQQAASNPSNTFYSVKRLMGRSWEEVQGLGLIYGLTKTSEAGVQLVCPATDSTLSPQQVRSFDCSSFIIRHCRRVATTHHGKSHACCMQSTHGITPHQAWTQEQQMPSAR
jgi:molecular chaperone DnaK